MPASTTAATPGPRRVAILVYDGVTLLDVAGPAEVFKTANRFGADYQIVLLSPTGENVTSNLGFGITVERDVSAEPAADTYLVPGSDNFPRTPVPSTLAEAAAIPAAGARRVASICTGAFILAAAGLLGGKRATTHWNVARELAARCPTCEVEPDAIYVRDGNTYTSAGVTAGIDLALALVEEDHGPDLTRDVARALVVYMQRAGGQSQFSAPLQGSPPRSPALRQVVDLVTADPQGDHSLAELAKHLNVSTRHLTRLFHDELSTTPARYVESIRFDMARALLDQGHNATQAAARAGFPSYESMRRVFVRKLSISPAAYQRRFSTARRAGSD
ncbi:GlxA family transcriptional regulator [Mycolicibacterium fortuitum]|uniref:ThiJ/PfpI domain-containing protein n=1 Tax=Mycolicibacterium fortuitum subsp. fortuitum DSM 46621 = ATCC 6841 = JCM 6387 TaxID=1214102 RepID=K0V3Y2_MYCFO|nr:GlxA family transcriptional regulator [Mycolicibacterium fortuitum]CRL79917.1 transcriptional regulator containing an amidase domain and an AraC-type DNA-binding HTH domain protein [Mycolicibacter nonchromogenicus]EJZ14032.1 ThiJ/PfpI domain-containing protein [Mycolicibacterium fortuitum subsp. fortuitum DSM 46621 = ATCC 6841 = JCM 6387]NOQ59677.1 GlxA family transcriptional regulator [Mycolicibacterium fortuitum]OBG45510.1 AraC family transcriptional regulator [Mycolicibacterium fortuitum]